MNQQYFTLILYGTLLILDKFINFAEDFY